MNDDIIKGKWKELKGKVKQHWGKFTDDEVTQMKGSYEELEGHLQTKYGFQKDAAKQEIDSFVKKHMIKDEE